VLLGPPDVGKSFFAASVAGLWGAEQPPPASLLVERFNGELKRCPIVFDDEAQLFGSKQLSTKRFREVSQSKQRSIELKGQEKLTLRGSLRMIVACNGITDLRFTDVGGPDVVRAVEDRLCVLDTKSRAEACKSALGKLRLPGAWECDRNRVVAYMAWMCETVQLPVERFVGAGGMAGDAVLAGHVEESAELWERLIDWLDDAEPAGSIWSCRPELCVNTVQLALTLEDVGRGWDLRRVRTALAPFKTRDYRPKTDGQPRLWVLDTERVGAALGWGKEEWDAIACRLGASDSGEQPRDPSSGRFGRFTRR